MTRDEQEALSRRYGDDIIMLLPLKSGNVAVFNAARELCGIIDTSGLGGHIAIYELAYDMWFAPTKRTTPSFTLEDLGL